MRLITPVQSFVLASLLLMGAAFNFPYSLYEFFSTKHHFAGSTLFEIRLLRAVLAVAGLSIAAAAAVWLRSAGKSWRRNLEEDFESYLQAPPLASDPSDARFTWFSVFLCLAVFLGLFQTIQCSFTYDGRGILWFDLLARENGVWESLTALCLFLSGALLIHASLHFRLRFPPPRAAFLVPLLLGLLFFAGGGEEIDWGQEAFGFRTPSALKKINVQEEFNLHNIGGYWINQLMMMFCFAYVCVLPILARWFIDVRYMVERLKIPLAPMALVSFGVVGLLMDERDFFNRLWGNPPWRLSEARETLFSVIFLCMVIQTCRRWRKRYTRP